MQRGLVEGVPLVFVAHQTSSTLVFIFLRCRTHFVLGFFSPQKKKIAGSLQRFEFQHAHASILL